jgi:drug/metabolite transporter (DMT)-like permease
VRINVHFTLARLCMCLLAEFMCLGWYYFRERCLKSNKSDGAYTALPSEGHMAGSSTSVNAASMAKPPLWFFAVLSCFDLTATLLTTIGVKWVTASAVQMLRGSTILFTGFCTVLIMKKSLTKGQWFGIFIVMVALAMVGVSSALRPKGTANTATSAQVFLGIVLILIGSLLNSIQGVVEETLLKGQNYAEMDPLEVPFAVA